MNPPLDKPGTDPNKGLNTRTFMASVFIALVVVLLLAYLFLRHTSHTIKSPTPPNPTSRLDVPVSRQMPRAHLTAS